MVRPVLALMLIAATVAAVRFTRSGIAVWREQRAGRAYGLQSEQRLALRHGAGAVVAGLCAAALLVALSVNGDSGTAPASSRAAASARPRPAPAAPGTPGAAEPVPPSAFSTVGRPAGGQLLQASLPAADGRLRTVRVWLPPQYASQPKTRFPVVVLQAGAPGRTADTEVPYVFEGFADAVQQRRATPFVIIAPQAPAGTDHPCELLAAAPEAVPDDAALRTVVTARFRTLPAGPKGWETLGLGTGAPCAAAAGLARSDLYGAAAALSGRYDAPALARTAADGRPGPGTPRLLLAAAERDTDGRDGVSTLCDALHSEGGRAARVRVSTSDVVRDVAADRERVRLVKVAAQYLTESLPGGTLPSH